MSKNLLETYRQLQEGILPDLKKPGIGPGSGQHSVGNMSVRSVPPAEAHKNLQSPSNAVNNLGIPRLNNMTKSAPAAPAPSSAAQQVRVNNALNDRRPASSGPSGADRAAIAQATKERLATNKTETQKRVDSVGNSQRARPGGAPNTSIKTDTNKGFPTKGGTATSMSQFLRSRNPAQSRQDSGDVAPGKQPGENRVRSVIQQHALKRETQKAATTALNTARPADSKQQLRPDVKRQATSSGQAQAATTTTQKPAPPAPKPAAQATPPKPTAKPAQQKQSFSQAFAAARKKAGGGSGVFTWNGKQYQTNVKGEKYQKISKLKKVNEQSHEESLGALEVRRKGEQQARGPRSYRVTTTNESGKRKVRINFEPENKYFAY